MKKDIYKDINELLKDELEGNYEDIINLSRPSSNGFPKMSKHDRAAQFAPFAALTGYEDAIAEEGRYVENRRTVTDEEQFSINLELNKLLNLVKEYKYGVKSFCSESLEKRKPTVIVKYFVPDALKSGGSYLSEEIRVREVDLNNRLIIAENNKFIGLDDVVGICVKEELK